MKKNLVYWMIATMLIMVMVGMLSLRAEASEPERVSNAVPTVDHWVRHADTWKMLLQGNPTRVGLSECVSPVGPQTWRVEGMDATGVTLDNIGNHSVYIASSGITVCASEPAVRWTGPGMLEWDVVEGVTRYVVVLKNENGERVGSNSTKETSMELNSFLGWFAGDQSQRYSIEVEARFADREKEFLVSDLSIDMTVSGDPVVYSSWLETDSTYILSLKMPIQAGYTLLDSWQKGENNHSCNWTLFTNSIFGFTRGPLSINGQTENVRFVTSSVLEGRNWQVTLTPSSVKSLAEIQTNPGDLTIPMIAASGSPVSGTCAFSQSCSDEGKKTEAYLVLNNSSGAEVETRLFVAGYSKEGRMTEVQGATVSVPAMGTAGQLLELDAGTSRVSVFVLDAEGHALTDRAVAKTDPFNTRAWFQVDENGRLSIETNLDPTEWGEYAVILRIGYTVDGRSGFDLDTQSARRASSVRYDANSFISCFNDGTVITSAELVVLNDINALDSFWSAQGAAGGDYETGIAAVSGQTVARLSLNNPISVTDVSELLSLTDFRIDYFTDSRGNWETYTARLREEISGNGEYGLIYQAVTGGQRAGMSYIARGEDAYTLTFKRNQGHFSEPDSGATGNFFISHCVYSMDIDGKIQCCKALSTPYPYTF